MNYFPRNPPKRTIRGVSNDTDQLRDYPRQVHYHIPHVYNISHSSQFASQKSRDQSLTSHVTCVCHVTCVSRDMYTVSNTGVSDKHHYQLAPTKKAALSLSSQSLVGSLGLYFSHT